jgi:hypothetical protein
MTAVVWGAEGESAGVNALEDFHTMFGRGVTVRSWSSTESANDPCGTLAQASSTRILNAFNLPVLIEQLFMHYPSRADAHRQKNQKTTNSSRWIIVSHSTLRGCSVSGSLQALL